MATSFFGNARKVEVHNHYGLNPNDLKKLEFWDFFKVAAFLAGILIFWIICGWSANYCLPIKDTLLIFASCFDGSFSEKFIRLQTSFSEETVNSQSNDGDLTNSYSKSQILLGILEKLNIDDYEIRIRIGNTAQAIRIKKEAISNLVDSRLDLGKRRFINFQDSFLDFQRSRSSRDYDLLNSITRDFLILSEKIKQAEIDRLSAVESLQYRIREAKDTFSPSRFEILDNLEVMLENLLSSEFSSSLNVESLESGLYKANGKINRLTSHIQHLLSEKEQLLFDIDDHRKSIRKLVREASDAKRKFGQLETEKLKSDASLGQAVGTLENQREYTKRLQEKTRSLESTIERLKSILEKKDKDLEELKKQFTESIKEKLSGLDIEQSQRVLQGRFIGNVSTKSKFHFDLDCPAFWTWVGRYLCSSDQNIISSESPEIFYEAGLEPCNKCAKKI